MLPLSLTATWLRYHIRDDIMAAVHNVYINELTCAAISLLKWYRSCQTISIAKQPRRFLHRSLLEWMQQQVTHMVHFIILLCHDLVGSNDSA